MGESLDGTCLCSHATIAKDGNSMIPSSTSFNQGCKANSLSRGKQIVLVDGATSNFQVLRNCAVYGHGHLLLPACSEL